MARPLSVLLTVVVPVYAVEEYLYQCLDSIRAGLTPEENAQVEVIAVDDASPDACGTMLDEYAARHGGLRVLHLAENVGLGRARNAGIEAATGRYLWFVDSDDLLPAGSVSAVLQRLQDGPDVLLIDYRRLHLDGRLATGASSRALHGEPTKERLLGLVHTAWNRIARRDLLIGNDLLFPPGWYEDVPFSNPTLVAAERIDVLLRDCYHYRVGRAGAITASRSERHFEVFEQYERMWEWVAGRDVPPSILIRLFGLMIDHLLTVAGNGERILPEHRRAFFGRIAELYRRHVPAGYLAPGGMAGVKHRLVAANAYPFYMALRGGYRVAGLRRLRRRATAPAGAGPGAEPTRSSPTVDGQLLR